VIENKMAPGFKTQEIIGDLTGAGPAPTGAQGASCLVIPVIKVSVNRRSHAPERPSSLGEQRDLKLELKVLA